MRRALLAALAAASCGTAHAQLTVHVERVAAPAAAVRAEPLSEDALPDGVPARGRLDIDAAWLAGPTGRYRHGVLGDAIEAGELRVRLRDGRLLSYVLREDSVFEDLRPRVVDLDGDGSEEVIVVKSRAGAGASLAVLSIRSGRLIPFAETPAIGTHHRWLNPVGVADVDGDGRLDVVLVQTPHLAGPLVAYTFGPHGFVEIGRVAGFSNHAIGSRALGLGALLDADGDGLPEAVVPAGDRRSLRVVSFAGGRIRDLGAVALPDEAAGDFVVDGRAVIVPLAGGGAVRVAFGRR